MPNTHLTNRGNEMVKKNREELIEDVVSELLLDIHLGDTTVLEELLGFIPTENLTQSLPEENWVNYEP
jgi:hypothetical protein